MLANGLQTKCMGKESSPGQTAESMKAIGLKDVSTVWVLI
jgi:hypothetical protein